MGLKQGHQHRVTYFCELFHKPSQLYLDSTIGLLSYQCKADKICLLRQANALVFGL